MSAYGADYVPITIMGNSYHAGSCRMVQQPLFATAMASLTMALQKETAALL